MRFEDEIPLLDQNRLRWDSAPKSLLGQGSFGMVYKGKWNGTPVAIKVVKPARAQSHSQEYEAAESAAFKQHRREIHRLKVVHNPYIIQYLGVFRGANPRDLYIVTEFLEGGSLFDSLTKMRARHAVMDHRSFLQLASHMAYGLCHVHSQKYTHGDVKPQNVLLTAAMSFDESSSSQINAFMPPTAKAKIADFGLSKRLSGAGPTGFDSTAATSDFGNGPCGTFLYMSPEAYDSVSNLTDDQAKAADVYAYGLILFEMLAGIQSWQVENARNPFQLGTWVRGGQRPSWGERRDTIRKEFSSLVERCWSQDPHDRPTFDVIVDELETLESKLDESGFLSSLDHYSKCESLDNANQPASFEDQLVGGSGQEDAPHCRTDPICNPELPSQDAPFLSDSFFAGIGSEASAGPTIRRVTSVRLADTVQEHDHRQFPSHALPAANRSGFDESYSSRKSSSLGEPHGLSQVHRSDAAPWPDGTFFYTNSFGLVEQQGEIDGSVIAGVPVKRVQSTYNVSTPDIEPLHISNNNEHRPTLGLGSFADNDPRRRNPRRSDGDLLNSWFGVGLHPFSAPQKPDAGNVNTSNLHPVPSLQTGSGFANPPAMSSNSKVQPGIGPPPSGSVFVHEAGAVGAPIVTGGGARTPGHVKAFLQFPQVPNASALRNDPHYGEAMPVPAAGNLGVGAHTKGGVPTFPGPHTSTSGVALASQSVSGSALGPSVPNTFPIPFLGRTNGPSINPSGEALQGTGVEHGESNFLSWRTNPYGSGPLPAGFTPMKTSPLSSPEVMDINAIHLALQRPDGRDHVMRLWSRGHLRTVAGGLAFARNLRGGGMLRLACDFLKESTQLPPDKLEPIVSRDLCTCIGNIARNDSDTLCPEDLLMAVRVALSTMFTHHTTFVRNDKSSVDAYVACNFALCNLFRVYNVISDVSFRADIAEWISFAISWNVHEEGIPAPFSDALGYAATSAARNFIWMNKDNLAAFTSTRLGNGPTSHLLWSISYFDWVGSARVVETSLCALAMVIHEPKQREDFTERQGLKVLTDVLGKHKTNLRVTKLVFAAIAMLLCEMHDAGDHLGVIRKGFLFDDGCQRLVSALNEVKDIPANPKLVMTTLQAGFDALHAVAALCDELRARVVRCGAITSMRVISAWLLSCEMQHFRDPNNPEMYFALTMLGKSMFALAVVFSEDSACAHLLETSGALASLEELNHVVDNR
eukprot:GFKZ01004069.1.p1 GENE.GFKZ01004069.1~~GFKZ01004069.1.p1  ORF type:complete len:1204 (-),score=131.06 GFKZ01004069.1:2526-6137(-)